MTRSSSRSPHATPLARVTMAFAATLATAGLLAGCATTPSVDAEVVGTSVPVGSSSADSQDADGGWGGAVTGGATAPPGGDACETIADTTLTNPGLAIDAPLVRTVDGQLPVLSPALTDPTELSIRDQWASLDEYAATFDDPGGRATIAAASEEAGFREGVSIDIVSPVESSSVRAFQLGDAARATTYVGRQGGWFCDESSTAAVLPSGNGFVFGYPDGSSEAILVAGDVELTAFVCVCATNPDKVVAATDWAERITAYLSTAA